MLDRTLTAARLRATVPTVDIISNTEVLVEVDLTWTGTGELSSASQCGFLEEHLMVSALAPPDQLWVIAQAVEENGGPAGYVAAVRAVADRLGEMGRRLAEPLEGPTGAPLRRSGQ